MYVRHCVSIGKEDTVEGDNVVTENVGRVCRRIVGWLGDGSDFYYDWCRISIIDMCCEMCMVVTVYRLQLLPVAS